MLTAAFTMGNSGSKQQVICPTEQKRGGWMLLFGGSNAWALGLCGTNQRCGWKTMRVPAQRPHKYRVIFLLIGQAMETPPSFPRGSSLSCTPSQLPFLQGIPREEEFLPCPWRFAPGSEDARLRAPASEPATIKTYDRLISPPCWVWLHHLSPRR